MCSDLKDQVEATLKQIGMVEVDDITDSSAPRAAMRANLEAAGMAEINANLTLMQATRCPVFPRPIRASTYKYKAFACDQAISKQVDTEQSGSTVPTPAECGRSKWSPAP